MQEEMKSESKSRISKIVSVILKWMIAEQIIVVIALGIDVYSLLIANGPSIYDSIIHQGLSIYETIANDILKNMSINRIMVFVILFNVVYFIGKLSQYKKFPLGEKIYQYRFLLVGIIFVFCVLLKVNGSSISCWNGYIGQDTTGIILGKNRGIRSDEWAANTPMAFTQYYNDFKPISSIVRGTNTDIFIVYGQPVKDINIIFRPFQIGYLFLNQEMGLAFFWCGRWLALFLVTFEFGMLITKKHKKFSLVLAMMMTLSPTIQWWFAVNRISGNDYFCRVSNYSIQSIFCN